MHLSHHTSTHILAFLGVFAVGVFMMGTAFAREITVSEKAWVSGETQSFSSSKDFPFKVAGGTVLGGSMPMRAYISIEGVVGSGGTLRALIDGDPASEVDVTLPPGGNREFSAVIPDVANKLAHTTAGTYDHTLTLDPGGVSVIVNSTQVTNTYTWEIGFDCPEGAETSIKQKTVQLLLTPGRDLTGTNDLEVSYSFTDNMSGITNPITSAYAEITGNYTGSGSVTISFPEDASLTTTYSLSDAGGPRQISLLSPSVASLFQSATTTSHTIRISTSGVTLSPGSVKFLLTYQYHPAAVNCGGFPPTGEFTSEVLDTNWDDPIYNSIAWRGELGGAQKDTGHVKFELATSNCQNGASDYPTCTGASNWQWVGGATCGAGDWFEPVAAGKPLDLFRTGCSSSLDGKRYYRYKVQLCASDCTKAWPTTPTVREVYVSWSP